MLEAAAIPGTSLNILFLTKRQYTGKDLVDDRFGRYWHIPLELARRGHRVVMSCLSYRDKNQGWIDDITDAGSLRVHSRNAGPFRALGLARFAREARDIGRDFRPDIVLAGSDSLYGIIGEWCARRLGVPFVFDLYDNYAAFGAHRILLVRPLYRRALRHAAAVTCVSRPLADHLRHTARPDGLLSVITNGVDEPFCVRQEKAAARAAFDLPQDVPLVAVVGAIAASRGIEYVFRAFELLKRSLPDARLILAGPIQDTAVPSNEDIHYLGVIPYDRIPVLLAAIDVAVVPNLPSPFGEYCFPQKFYEALATGTPVVAARVGALRELLNDWPTNTYAYDDPDELADKIAAQVTKPVLPNLPVPLWRDLAVKFEGVLDTVRTGND